MKKLFLGLTILSLFSFCNEKSSSDFGSDQLKEIQEVIETKMEETMQDSVLRHTVFFSFKEGTTEVQITTVVDAFRDLKNKIPGIENFEWGVNSSPEGINKGLTHAFTLTFFTEEARDTYLPHPDHKAFGEVLGPYLEDVMVVDYWTRP